MSTVEARGTGPESSSAGPASPALGHVFVARQPILDRERRVHGYELLFHPTSTAEPDGSLDGRASARVIADAALAFGLHTLTNGRRAFVNVPHRLLLEGIPAALPPKQVVLELQDDVEADDEVVKACRELRRAGYAIALDNFTLGEKTAPLVGVANFLKMNIDVRPDLMAINRLVTAPGASGARPAFIAQNLDHAEQFVEAQRGAFGFFQGAFIGRPVTQGARNVPGHRLGHLKLLGALYEPDLSIYQLENLIKQDATLCYRVLRAVNSAGYGLQSTVTSIRDALVLLGRDSVRRWTSLWVMASLSTGAPPELVSMSSVRARFCELIGGSALGDERVDDGFLLGMCSMLDAILEVPMPVVISQLPLNEDTRAALRGDDTPGRRLLDCAMAYERGAWDRCVPLAKRAGVDEAKLPAAYLDALRWSGLLGDN